MDIFQTWFMIYVIVTKCYVRQAKALSHYTLVKNTLRNTEKTDNAPTDKTEHVTLGMKKSQLSNFVIFLRNSNNKYNFVAL